LKTKTSLILETKSIFRIFIIIQIYKSILVGLTIQRSNNICGTKVLGHLYYYTHIKCKICIIYRIKTQHTIEIKWLKCNCYSFFFFFDVNCNTINLLKNLIAKLLAHWQNNWIFGLGSKSEMKKRIFMWNQKENILFLWNIELKIKHFYGGNWTRDSRAVEPIILTPPPTTHWIAKRWQQYYIDLFKWNIRKMEKIQKRNERMFSTSFLSQL
jgi:hypothetical protein